MNKKLNVWFWLITIVHLVIWTALPTAVRYTLPMDASEGYMWGTHLDWGYDRDPWLNAWLTRLAVDIGGHSGWLVYGLSQLCVLLAFWSVWRLGQQILNPVYAFFAVFLLEGIQYYHLAAIDFNDNVLELALWALMAFLLYQALTIQKIRYWLLFGVASGLGLMAKYYTAFPLLCMALFILSDSRARMCLKKIGPYLSIVIMLIIALPHILWLFDHDFITIHYTQHRVGAVQKHWFDQFYPALRFASLQILTFVGGVILCLPMLLSRSTRETMKQSEQPKNLIAWNRKFLWWVGVGPFVVTLLLSLATAWKLNTMWGTPLLSLWGLIVFSYWKPQITTRRLSIFIGCIFFVLFGFALGYFKTLTKPGVLSSANEPAQDLVKMIERLWFQHTAKPLYYVAGHRYLVSYAVYLSHQHPKAFIDYSLPYSPWIDEDHLRAKGAIFVERLDEGAQEGAFPAAVMQRYPNLKVLPVQHLEYHRAVEGRPSLDVLVGILLPEGSAKKE